jgi:hypothetical protein
VPLFTTIIGPQIRAAFEQTRKSLMLPISSDRLAQSDFLGLGGVAGEQKG